MKKDIQELLIFFKYEHLPPHLQKISKPLCESAKELAGILPPNRQAYEAINNLLLAKDCAVRSAGLEKWRMSQAK